MQLLDNDAIKARLAPPADHDWETDDHHRLTLDRERDWYEVQCLNGHSHMVTPAVPLTRTGNASEGASPVLGPIDFDCYEGECAGTRYTVTPEVEPDDSGA